MQTKFKNANEKLHIRSMDGVTSILVQTQCPSHKSGFIMCLNLSEVLARFRKGSKHLRIAHPTPLETPVFDNIRRMGRVRSNRRV